MENMHLIDLHCDTLYKSVQNKISFSDKSLEVSLDNNMNRLQCYAVWIPDELNGEQAEQLFNVAYSKLEEQCNANNINLINNFSVMRKSIFSHNSSAIFTVENSKALNGEIKNVKRLADCGVKMMTLTWNAHNDVGDGSDVDNANGITEFGKIVVSEMESNNIVVDISHASDKLFYDVAEISKRPFVASHSNSRAITNHKRNLTDEQFKIIVERKGLVGINFHNEFLSHNPKKAKMTDILRHVDHLLEFGGENCLCFGSDFDGCTLPKDIKGSSSMQQIFDMFLKHKYSESLINKIFYENALKFFENFDNQRIM